MKVRDSLIPAGLPDRLAYMLRMRIGGLPEDGGPFRDEAAIATVIEWVHAAYSEGVTEGMNLQKSIAAFEKGLPE